MGRVGGGWGGERFITGRFLTVEALVTQTYILNKNVYQKNFTIIY